MIDLEKVVKAWKIFRDSNPYEICNGREFRAINEPEYCMGQMIEDTIELLKEQKAVKPKVIGTNEFRCPIHACGKCGFLITESMNYCHECGKRIDWEGRRSRMIDRKKVINQFEADVKRAERTGEMFVYVGRKTATDAIALLKDQRNGEWLFDRQGHWKCSECGYIEGRIAMTEFRNYCPVCGAKMEGR